MKALRALVESVVITGIMMLVYEIMYYSYMFLIRMAIVRQVPWLDLSDYVTYNLDEQSLYYMKDHPVEYTLLCWVILLMIFLMLLAASHQPIKSTLKLKGLSLRNGIVAWVMALGLIMSVGGLSQLLALEQGQEGGYLSLGMMEVYSIVFLLLSVGVMAPIFEELFFRGLIMSRLGQGFGSFFSVLLSSLLFSISHLNLFQGLFVLPVGLMAGLIVCKTKSIWAGVWLHVVYNSVNIILAYRGLFEYNSRQLVVLVAMGLIVLATSYQQLDPVAT